MVVDIPDVITSANFGEDRLRRGVKVCPSTLTLIVALTTVQHYRADCDGIRGVVHSWFASYLSNRMQYTFVNNHTVLLVSCQFHVESLKDQSWGHFYFSSI